MLAAGAGAYWALSGRPEQNQADRAASDQAPPTDVIATIPIDQAVEVRDVTVLPDGSAVLTANTGSNGGSVSVIDPATNTVKSTIDLGPESSAFDLATLPDGSAVYVASPLRDEMWAIDPTTSSVVASIPVVFPWAQAVAADGSALSVRSNDGVVRIDTVTNTVVATYPITGPNDTDLRVTPDGSAVYVTQPLAGSVSVIDTASNTSGIEIPVDEGPIGLALLPDGSKAYVTNGGRWDTESGTFRPAGTTVSVIDAKTGNVVASIPVGEAPVSIVVLPDGSAVYVTNYGSDSVSVIDTAQHKVLATIPVGDDPYSLTLLPDGSAVYVANQADDTVSVIDTTTHTVRATIPVGDGPLQLVALPDGSAVYVANMKDHSVTVIGAPGK